MQEGLAALKKAVELIPNNPSIHYHLALAYKENGDKQKAKEILQKAIKLGDFPELSHAKELLTKLQK
jgi:FimV-like protein